MMTTTTTTAVLVFVFHALVVSSMAAISRVNVENGKSEATWNATRPTIGADDAQNSRALDDILKDVYATISKNMVENTRKLNLEDFSCGLLSGAMGRLQGFDHFHLINNNTVTTARKRKLQMYFEFILPLLKARWHKSVCFGYDCAMTMELQNATFVLRMLFDAQHCIFEHLAFLKNYQNAKCYVEPSNTSTIASTLVQTAVKLLSQVISTKPFQKLIKDNVDYALLQLPLFNAEDIKRVCDAYQQI